MGIETVYRLNCDACNKQEETSDARRANIKKLAVSYHTIHEGNMQIGKAHWTGWLCPKCAEETKVKILAATKDLGGEHS